MGPMTRIPTIVRDTRQVPPIPRDKLKVSYILSQETWYARQAQGHETRDAFVVLGKSKDEDSAYFFEFTIEVKHLQDGQYLGLRLLIFDESWHAFRDIPELFAGLGSMEQGLVSAHTVEALLKRLGYEDATQYTRPLKKANLTPFYERWILLRNGQVRAVADSPDKLIRELAGDVIQARDEMLFVDETVLRERSSHG